MSRGGPVLHATLCPLALALAAGLACAATAQVPEPQGYRGPPYQAPVPTTLHGAIVIGVDEAMRLHADGVPFIDVHPRTARPAGLPEGTLWREPAHETIPGAVWLPCGGYERLSTEESDRFARGIRAVTGGDKARPFVVFCRADCWMSWNAAKRAAELGYGAVRWYPEGTDGWLAAGGELTAATPPPD